MSLPFNQSPTDPTLSDVLDAFQKNLSISLNCHHIGTIQEFDETEQTASVTINYKKTYYTLNDATGLYDPILVDYPMAVQCPVIFLGGGETALTFPVAAGDECILLFNDRDIDNWFQNGGGAGLATPRLHSFADAIALVGVRSMNNVIDSLSTTAAQLRSLNGTASVGVSPTSVVVKHGTNVVTLDTNKYQIAMGSGLTVEFLPSGKFRITNATAEFVAALQQLFVDIQGATAGGFPLVMPTFVTDLAKLVTFKV